MTDPNPDDQLTHDIRQHEKRCAQTSLEAAQAEVEELTKRCDALCQTIDDVITMLHEIEHTGRAIARLTEATT